VRARALDLFCGAGGMSYGLELAGFDVTAVDIHPQKHHRGGRFVRADALDVLLDLEFLRGFDFIHASPPCQSYSSLRHLQKGKVYPDLIAQVRASLAASGAPYSIENVPGAPLGGNLTMLCGTMFGLQTPDGRAEIRRHRLFETSWPIALRPACQHGYRPESLSVCGTGMGVGNKGKEAEVRAKRTLVVTGHSYQGADAHSRRKVLGMYGDKGQDRAFRKGHRETFSIADARAAMQIDWMPMKSLSQAIPPAYGKFIGTEALRFMGRA
jgi:DNA (cytosine-5)-methyltransferase 1